MYTVDDLTDAIVEQIAEILAQKRSKTRLFHPEPAGPLRSPFEQGKIRDERPPMQVAERVVSGGSPKTPNEEKCKEKRIFLTEYEIKQALTPDKKELTIGSEVIISPLALEWLELKGIRIVRTRKS